MTAEAIARRGTSNANDRGSTRDRRARRKWLMENYRADMDLARPGDPEFTVYAPLGRGIPAVRCYRCGDVLGIDEVTIDRIKPGHKGGRYTRDNIRPACGPCNFGSTRAVGRWEDE